MHMIFPLLTISHYSLLSMISPFYLHSLVYPIIYAHTCMYVYIYTHYLRSISPISPYQIPHIAIDDYHHIYLPCIPSYTDDLPIIYPFTTVSSSTTTPSIVYPIDVITAGGRPVQHDEYRLPELSGRGESGEDETVFGDGMKGPSERVNQHYPLVNIQKTMENHYF